MEDLHATLFRSFGFTSFRPGQEAIIRTLLEGNDALVIMPTGAGKSLCFQLPALMMQGTTLVVSPLIALMKDQVDALTARKIPVAALNSSCSKEESTRILRNMRMGFYKLVYVAPERFRNPRFIEALKETPLSMLAIDEAHCISAWGHDFRPDYLHLGEYIAHLPANIRILAVTATATEFVQQDITLHLGLGENKRHPPKVFVTGFERPNLALNVTPVRSHAQKLERLLQVIEFFRCGIVYCSTRKMVERVYALLLDHGIKALTYNGAMEDRERTLAQEAFMRRETPVVIATNAFGMGVDRPDIRFVVHWDIPGSMEAYYQEVGRAGRDGAYAWCELLYSYADVKTQEFFIAAANPPPEHIYELYATIRNACHQSKEGTVTLSSEAWAEQSGLKSETAVRQLTSRFERKGLLTRTRKIGESHATFSIPKDADVSQLQSICKEIASKDRADRKRLDELLRYVTIRSCRHQFLLSYFGDSMQAAHCSKCDNCHPLSHFPARLLPSPSRLIQIRKILSCVVRLHGAGDFNLVADILRGEAAANYRKLTTFGILTEASKSKILNLLESLELDGYLIGMQLTPKGYDLVLDRTEIVPIAHLTKKHPSQTEPQKTPPPPPTPLPEEGVATALRKWVLREAKQRGIPPYCVLNTKTIAAIAKHLPTNELALSLIPGIGEQKLAKYAEAILAITTQYE